MLKRRIRYCQQINKEQSIIINYYINLITDSFTVFYVIEVLKDKNLEVEDMGVKW